MAKVPEKGAHSISYILNNTPCSSSGFQLCNSPLPPIAFSYFPSSPSQIASIKGRMTSMDPNTSSNGPSGTSRPRTSFIAMNRKHSPANTGSQPSSNGQDASNSYCTPPLTGCQDRQLMAKHRLLNQSETLLRINQTLSSSPIADAIESSKDMVDVAFQVPMSPRPSTPIRGGSVTKWNSISSKDDSPTNRMSHLDAEAATPIFSDGAKSRDSSRHGSKTPQASVRPHGGIHSPPNAPKFDSILMEFGLGPIIEDESSPTTHTKAAARRRKQQQELQEMQARQSKQIPRSSPPKSRKVAVRTIPAAACSPSESEYSCDQGDENQSPVCQSQVESGSDQESEPELNLDSEQESEAEPEQNLGAVDRIEQLERENAALKSRMTKLEKRMSSIVNILSQMVDHHDSLDQQLEQPDNAQDGNEAELKTAVYEEEADESTDCDADDHDDEHAETDIENQDPVPCHAAAPLRRSKSERGPFGTVPLDTLYSPETLRRYSQQSPASKRRQSSLELSMSQSFRLQKKLRLHENEEDI